MVQVAFRLWQKKNRFQYQRSVRKIKHMHETSVSTILSKPTSPEQQFTTVQTACACEFPDARALIKAVHLKQLSAWCTQQIFSSSVFLSSGAGAPGLRGWAARPVVWLELQLYRVDLRLEPLLPQLWPRCLHPHHKQELGLSPADWDQTVPGQAMPDSAARAPKAAAGQYTINAH